MRKPDESDLSKAVPYFNWYGPFRYSIYQKENARRIFDKLIEEKYKAAYMFAPRVYGPEKALEILDRGIALYNPECEYEKMMMSVIDDSYGSEDYQKLCDIANRGSYRAKLFVAKIDFEEAMAYDGSYAERTKALRTMCDNVYAQRWSCEMREYLKVLMPIYMETHTQEEFINHMIIDEYAPDELKWILQQVYTLRPESKVSEYDMYKLLSKLPYEYEQVVLKWLLDRNYPKAYDYYLFTSEGTYDNDIVEKGHKLGADECSAEMIYIDLVNRGNPSKVRIECSIRDLENIAYRKSIYAHTNLARIYAGRFGYKDLEKSLEHCKFVIENGYEDDVDEVEKIIDNILCFENKYAPAEEYKQELIKNNYWYEMG